MSWLNNVNETNIISYNSLLSPWFITGFADAESTFSHSISRNESSKFGWIISLSFAIQLSVRDIDLLQKIQLFFGVGTISYSKDKKLVVYRVRSLNDLSVIIKFFKSFPFITSKRYDFNLFVLIYELLCKKEHLSLTGFFKSIAIINNINYPIKSNLLAEIVRSLGPLPSLIIPPIIYFKNYYTIPSPWWIIGFICGESSFTYGTSKYLTKKLGERIKYQLIFELAQKTKDIKVLQMISIYLGVGIISSEARGISKLKIGNIQHLQHVLVPFLLSYPLVGFKSLQFNIWIKALEIKLSYGKKKYKYSQEKENKLQHIFNELTELRKN